jgi:hypothetical protein
MHTYPLVYSIFVLRKGNLLLTETGSMIFCSLKAELRHCLEDCEASAGTPWARHGPMRPPCSACAHKHGNLEGLT